MNGTIEAPRVMTVGRVQPGQSFAPCFLLPLSDLDERMIDRLIQRTIERGGAASKLTTDTTVTVRIYPRGEA